MAAAALGGAAMHLLHVPLAWMIGAMAATAALAWHRPVAVPGWARPAGLVFLGLGLGSTFTGPVLAAVTAALPVMLACGVLAILSGLVVAPLFTRLAGTDLQTGFFCAVPGGVIVMAVLAQEARASVATVTLAQTMRVLVVVLTFPPLLGWLAPHGDFSDFTGARVAVWWPGLALMAAAGLLAAWPLRLLGLANPWMLGPCALGITLAATGHLPSGVPSGLVDAAQVAMGASLGTRLTRSFLLSSRRLAIASMISAGVLSVLLTLLAVGIGRLAGLPSAAMILGMAPGGMPEMALTAKALELGVPLVLGFHLTRTVLCNLLVGRIHQWAVRLGLLG
ncbi:AbrB family transcriptional regulator [Paeniroseomonas aquatica]